MVSHHSTPIEGTNARILKKRDGKLFFNINFKLDSHTILYGGIGKFGEIFEFFRKVANGGWYHTILHLLEEQMLEY